MRRGNSAGTCRRVYIWLFRIITILLLIAGLATTILGPTLLFTADAQDGGEEGWFRAVVIVFGVLVVATAGCGVAGSFGAHRALIAHITLLVPVVLVQSVFTVVLSSDNVTMLASIEAKYGTSPLLHSVVDAFRSNMLAFKLISASILLIESAELILGIHLLRTRWNGSTSSTSPFLPRYLQRQALDWRGMDVDDEDEHEATLVGVATEEESRRMVREDLRRKYMHISKEESEDEDDDSDGEKASW
eukprot:CAMPEP_0113900878 /NCGR_PEP_ID=MMETSP0780_2-20120614/20934_1 /TAXON_ID=652834 /ORGANISM="Palpitomonas bilix" /LENGTH=245 /DNA_ID=CAMNT_0000893411 /DNA_START=130 /DNA_END=864 /DNA_ORIENTATION=+ /assembly_acc=CAM_ASM_000599